MFTGIVTAVGTVAEAAHGPGGLSLSIDAPYRRVVIGESIAVDGACLTVEARSAGRFTVYVIATSLERTSFGSYAAGTHVNLERALRPADRLGGHLVQGHVDGVGRVTGVAERGDAWLMDVRVPDDVAAVSVPLGSVTVDGVSLTINAMPSPDVIQVSLIPFTLRHTVLGERRPGDAVHLEGDTVGKYVRRLLSAHLDRAKG